MSKRTIIILIVLTATVVACVVLLTTGHRKRDVVVPSEPTASATADPFAADRELIGRLSAELGVKFFTYTSPSAPDYLASIKPYLSATFYQDTIRLNQKYANIPGGLPAEHSEAVDSSAVTNISATEATASVTVKTTEGQAVSYQQQLRIHWVKTGDRWFADSILIDGTDKASPSPEASSG